MDVPLWLYPLLGLVLPTWAKFLVQDLLLICVDWCCQYGQNHLFKVDVCWITYEVDYMNQYCFNFKRKKKKKKTFSKTEILKCP